MVPLTHHRGGLSAAATGIVWPQESSPGHLVTSAALLATA